MNQSSTQEQKRTSSLPRNRPQEPSDAIIANMNTGVGRSTYPRMCQLVALWVRYEEKGCGMFTGQTGYYSTHRLTATTHYLNLIKNKVVFL